MHLPGTAKFPEALEDAAGDLPDAAIRIEAESDFPMRDIAYRYGNPEFTTASLGPRRRPACASAGTKFDSLMLPFIPKSNRSFGRHGL